VSVRLCTLVNGAASSLLAYALWPTLVAAPLKSSLVFILKFTLGKPSASAGPPAPEGDAHGGNFPSFDQTWPGPWSGGLGGSLGSVCTTSVCLNLCFLHLFFGCLELDQLRDGNIGSSIPWIRMSLGSWRLACWRAPWPDRLVSFLPQAHADALKQSFRDVNSMLRADSAGPGFCEGSDDVLKVPNRLLLPNTTEEDEDFDADELMSNLSRNSSVRLASLSLPPPPPKIMQTIVWDGWGVSLRVHLFVGVVGSVAAPACAAYF